MTPDLIPALDPTPIPGPPWLFQLLLVVTFYLLYLAPVAPRFETAFEPQWGNFALFAVCLVLALATVAWMVRRVVVDRAAGEEAA